MGVFTITIFSNGAQITTPYVLYSVDILHEVNKIPYAQLTFVDGNPATQAFLLSNSTHFIPGQELEISIRYEEDAQTETTLFKGIIVKHAIEADVDASYLTIELKDSAVKMTTTRKNKLYRDQGETDIFRQLIEDNGLEVGEIATIEGEGEPEDIVQYYCSDWDFLLSRTDVYGWWVHTNAGNISIINPADIDTSQANHSFSYGLDNIFNVHLEIDAEHQLDQVDSTSWDIANQATTEPTQAVSFETGIGNVPPSDLASALGATAYHMQSILPLNQIELQAWSDSKLRKSRFGMVRGYFSVRGIPQIQPLEVMEIAGISDRFNGNAIISAVRHRISAEGWFTDVQFGIQPDSYLSKYPVEAQRASGLLPAIQGLQMGIIDAFEEDPEEQFRLKVKLPALGADAEAIWARLASPDAGNGRGFFFRPETGDEVIVGFLNNDPRHAIVLGGLFSQVLPPPVESDQISDTNPIKGIFSREGLQIKIDDENKVLKIITSDDHLITLDQTEELIEIKDLHGNQMTLNADGITIKSAKDVIIEADGNVEITGQKVDIK